MNINLAPVDEAQLNRMVEEGHYTSVDEAVRFAVKTFLHTSYLTSPFYGAVMQGAQSLADGKGVVLTDEIEDALWAAGVARADAGTPPSADVVPH